MRGVVFKGNREAEIREFPAPHARPGEAVVKIRASLWCVLMCPRIRRVEQSPLSRVRVSEASHETNHSSRMAAWIRLHVPRTFPAAVRPRASVGFLDPS
jgi:hypothetical protein